MFKKSIVGLFFISLCIFYSIAISQYDVPFEPSSYEIVEKMLGMANVTKNDKVYDLGCGDGRIVIAAAKEHGAKGVGIDIDPLRIRESKENAMKEKVTDKVRFIEQNLFEADIIEATVVTLFLYPSVNLKLRPKLFRELRPGTRIVSHEHNMGEWEPDRTMRVDADDWTHTIYLWVLPANLSGTWEWTVSNGRGKRLYVLNLKQKFQKVRGTLSAGVSNIPIEDISIEGNRLRFTIEEDRNATYEFDGSADGNSIEGKILGKTKTKSEESGWKAKRDPSTILPLDE